MASNALNALRLLERKRVSARLTRCTTGAAVAVTESVYALFCFLFFFSSCDGGRGVRTALRHIRLSLLVLLLTFLSVWDPAVGYCGRSNQATPTPHPPPSTALVELFSKATLGKTPERDGVERMWLSRAYRYHLEL